MMAWQITRGSNHSVCITYTNDGGSIKFWSEEQIDTASSEAVRRVIKLDLEAHIRQIREHAYEAGWRDAKSKIAPKRVHFHGCINIDPKSVGY